MHVNCSHCGALCNVSDSLIGQNVRCGNCSQVFLASSPDAAQGTAPSPEGDPSPVEFESAGQSEGFDVGEGFDESEIGFDFDVSEEELLKSEEKSEPVLGDNPPAVHGLYRLDIGSCTSTGMVRDRNEDSFLVQHNVWSNLDTRHEMALILVADGMGGHQAGDVASKMTLQAVSRSLTPVLGTFYTNPDASRPASYRAPLLAAISTANEEVYNLAQSEQGKKGMGATAALVLIWDGKVDIGHVGDCRVYHFTGGTLRQVTKDQTLVERMIELGQLTRAEAAEHAGRGEVTQGIGIHAKIEPAHYQLQLNPGDWLIVACDGLHAHVTADMLSDTLQAAPSSAALVAHYLVDLANHHGGSDNCTVVAVRCF